MNHDDGLRPAPRPMRVRFDALERKTAQHDAEHPVSRRQHDQYEATEDLVDKYGKFDQSTGPNGAHYVAKSPFASQGMICANCLYYEGSRQCEVVKGDIDPQAICKLWIIPGSLIEGPDASTPVLREKSAATPPDRAGALRLARRIGCEGAHEIDGGWAPCPTPEALRITIREGRTGFEAWRAEQDRPAEKSVRAEIARFYEEH